MPTSEIPFQECSDACIGDFEPACSSSSSGITCTHAALDSDNPDADEASSHKDIEASGSLAMAWTDSKHSSYLNFMEQNFVRDLYEREYCALDVCGQPSQRPFRVEEAPDPNSAESPFPTPFGPMEFKVWDNGNWTWRQDCKRKVNRCTLLSNPWFKHFRRQSSPGSDTGNTTLARTAHDMAQTMCGDSGLRGVEISLPVCQGDSELKVELQINQPSLQGVARSRKRTAQVNGIERGSTMRRRASQVLDEGSVAIGMFREVCEEGDGGDSHFYHACVQGSGDG